LALPVLDKDGNWTLMNHGATIAAMSIEGEAMPEPMSLTSVIALLPATLAGWRRMR